MVKRSPIPQPCKHAWADAEVQREVVTFGRYGSNTAQLVLFGSRTCRRCGAEEEFKLASMPWSTDSI